MPASRRFKIGSEVTAQSFSGQKIIGYYRGVCASFGVWVYGFIWGQDPTYDFHKCASLTMEPLKKAIDPKLESAITFTQGEPCTGKTKNGDLIRGEFQQTAGPKYAYIRGTLAKYGGPMHVLEKQAFKVLRSTLVKA